MPPDHFVWRGGGAGGVVGQEDSLGAEAGGESCTQTHLSKGSEVSFQAKVAGRLSLSCPQDFWFAARNPGAHLSPWPFANPALRPARIV